MQPLRIAFVAFSKRADLFRQDPSYIYRCENLAMALTVLGHTCDLIHYSQLSGLLHADNKTKKSFDIIVFHRPKISRLHAFAFQWQVRKLRKQGVKLIADFDDLVFDAEWAHASPGVINLQVSLSQTVRNFQSHQRALADMDFVSVSTTPLLDKIQRLMPSAKCLFLPNQVHLRWRNQFSAEPSRIATLKPERPRLTYFPGTRSHDKDFATISEPLSDFLNDHPDIQLQITGPLNLEQDVATRFQCRPDQLIRFEKQSFDNYAHHVASSWVNLAPLQNTVFNQHKSALKAIEAAYFNALTIASPIPDMQRLSSCASQLADYAYQDWYSALGEAFSHASNTEHTTSLRDKFLQSGSIEQEASRWLTWLGYSPAASELKLSKHHS